MRGALAPGVVPEVLRAIYVDRRTGMLRFIRGEERRGLRFMSGHIMYGEAGVPALQLRSVLVAEGRVAPEVLARASEAVGREGKRLGAVLLEMGALDEPGLEEALALQVRAILRSVFALREGVFTFQPQDPETFLADDWPLALSTPEAILSAVDAIATPEDVQYALGDLDRALRAPADSVAVFQRMELRPVHEAVRARVDGKATARELLKTGGAPPAERARALLTLLCTGVVEYVPTAPAAHPAPALVGREEILARYARLATATDREVLGVRPEAGEGEVRRAYFRLAERFNPDLHQGPEMGELRPRVEAIFFRVQQAYQALVAHRPPSPTPPAAVAPPAAAAASAAPAPAAPVDVEAALRAADDRLRDGKYWEAILLLEPAVEAATGPARTRARVLLGRALLKYPDREKQGEKELLAALHDDPEQVEAHYLLGALYRRRGLVARATTMLQRALELSPRHRAARAELDAIEDAPAREGRLRKLFGHGRGAHRPPEE